MDEVGTHLLHCRPKPLLTFLRDAGWDPTKFVLTVIECYIVAPLLVGVPILVLAAVFRAQPPIISHPLWGPILITEALVVWTLLTLWLLVVPRRQVCDLYERGMVVRTVLRRRTIEFAGLESIVLGGHARPAPLLLRIMGYGTAMRRGPLYTATFLFRDGTTWQAGAFLIRFEETDLELLLRTLEEREPDLMTSGLMPS